MGGCEEAVCCVRMCTWEGVGVSRLCCVCFSGGGMSRSHTFTTVCVLASH